MMDTYEEKQIQELPLGVQLFKRKAEDFLKANGLRLEGVDSYIAIQDADEQILAGGGISKDTIKCVAVSEKARSEGLAAPLISRLIAMGAERGYTNMKVFTKPSNRAIFESLGFRLLAEAPKAIFMENGRGLAQYCDYLSRCFDFAQHDNTVILMNANPFHLGHRNLVERAAALGRPVFVIVVKEDLSRFSYQERLAMVRAGLPASIGGVPVTVCEGSDYQISAATFPTYFLKELTDASETQMRLDLDLFCRHIAPALNAAVRVVGSEPSDALTARYNALMKEVLPASGISVQEFPRFGDVSTSPDMTSPVCGTDIRTLLDSEDGFCKALEMVPESSRPYLFADRAIWALQKELSIPLKPGLVGPDGSGAHADMDYALMLKGIGALRPWFAKLGCLGLSFRPDTGLSFRPEDESRSGEITSIGIAAEQAMLEATGGINTHKGAIFALGLALYACGAQSAGNQQDMQKRLAETAKAILNNRLALNELSATGKSHGQIAAEKYGVKGALAMAADGYKALFSEWLPFYRAEKHSPMAMQRLLLLIMSSLDDTCVIHRVGYERAQEVKKEASALLENFSREGLEKLCSRYSAERISPGGAADMLALTLFIDSIEVNN